MLGWASWDGAFRGARVRRCSFREAQRVISATVGAPPLCSRKSAVQAQVRAAGPLGQPCQQRHWPGGRAGHSGISGALKPLGQRPTCSDGPAGAGLPGGRGCAGARFARPSALLAQRSGHRRSAAESPRFKPRCAQRGRWASRVSKGIGQLGELGIAAFQVRSSRLASGPHARMCQQGHWPAGRVGHSSI